MATRFYLRSTSASDITGSTVEYRALTAAGTPTVTKTTNTGTPPVQVTDTAGGTALEWFTEPLRAGSISAETVTFNLWGAESAAQANTGFRVDIDLCDVYGNVISSVISSTITTELPTTAAAQNWTGTATARTINHSNRLRIRVYGASVGGSMGSGRTFTITYNGNTGGASGDTYVNFATYTAALGNNGFGQAQAKIKGITSNFAQAQTLVNGTSTSGYDTFTRSATDSIGTADVGGAWSIDPNSTEADFDVNGSALVIDNLTNSHSASLRTFLSATSYTRIRTEFSFSNLPTTLTQLRLLSDRGTPDITSPFVGGVGALFTLASDGSTTVQFSKGSTLGSGGSAGTYVVGDVWYLESEFQLVGSNYYQRVTAWKKGTAKPAPQDSSGPTDATIVPPPPRGHAAIVQNSAGGSVSGTLTIDNFEVHTFVPLGYAQAQASIKQTYKGFAQAQVYIFGATNQFAQAQTRVRSYYFVCGAENTTEPTGSHWNGVTGSVTRDTAKVLTGSYALKFVTSASASYVTKTIGAGNRNLVTRFALYMPTLPAGSTRILEWGGSPFRNMFLNGTNGKLQLYDTESTNTFPLDQWVIVDVGINSSANPWTYTWSINGVAQTPTSSPDAATDLTTLFLGDTNVSTATWYVDNFAMTLDIRDFPIGNGMVIWNGSAEQWTTDVYYPKFAQAQAQIKATNNAFAQVQADIKATSLGFAQALSDIKQTYQGYAQANASIKLVQSSFAQANVLISGDYTYIQDNFNRSVTDSWGTASDSGGDWTSRVNPSDADVDGSKGILQILSAGSHEVRSLRTSIGLIDSLPGIRAAFDFTVAPNTDVGAAIIIRVSGEPYRLNSVQTGPGFGININAITGLISGARSTSTSSSVVTTSITGSPTYTAGETWSVSILAARSANNELRIQYKVFNTASPTTIYTREETVSWSSYTKLPGFVTVSTTNGSDASAVSVDNLHVIQSGAQGYAQSQARIKQTYQVFAQAQTDVKQTYQGYAQANASIKLLRSGYAQAGTLVTGDYSYVRDDFNRSVTDDWGTASESGGAWSGTNANFDVTGTKGTIVTTGSTQLPQLRRTAMAVNDSFPGIRVKFKITLDALPAVLSTTTVLVGRGGNPASAQPGPGVGMRIGSDGTITYNLQRSTTLTDFSADILGATYVAGEEWQFEAFYGRTSNGKTRSTGIVYKVGTTTRYSFDSTDLNWSESNTGFQGFVELKNAGSAGVLKSIDDLEVVYGGFTTHAQAQARIKQTYQGYAQAQALIQISINTAYGFAQAQTNIKQTYNAFSQSQTDVKQTYNAFAQAQVKIATTRVYAQAQADIKQTYQVYGQAQADIKQTYRGFGQAQAGIKRTYNGFAQAQSDIKQTYSQFAQTQANIKQTYFGFAQAQATLATTSYGFAQAQTKIATTRVYAQAQTWIEQTYNGFGQSQADIKATYNQFAQANAWIEQIYNRHAQAQAWVENTYNGFAQTQTDIKQTYQVYAQAQAKIATTRVYGQAQAWVEQTYNAFAQAQTSVKQTYQAYAQSQAWIEQIYNRHAQAQGQIKQTYNAFAQSQAQIKQTYQVYAQAVTWIEQTYNAPAQAQTWIEQTYNSFAQAQAQIKTTYNIFAQSNAWIEATYNACAQAGAWVENTYTVSSQAQADIKQTYVACGQAQASIKATYNAFGQSQTWIEQTYNGHGQSQADILQTYQGYAQANAWIENTYNGYAQAQTSIKAVSFGYGQAQAKLNAFGVKSFAQAQALVGGISFGWAQAQAKIRAFGVKGYAQAQADIKATYQGFAQGQADIRQTYNGFGQVQSDIKQTYQGYANAQAQIKQSYQAYAQAQTWIKNTYQGYSQSQADIKNTYQGYAQAQTLIGARANAFGQAQTSIKATTTQCAQAQAQIKNSYVRCAQAQARIKSTYNGYAQAQTYIVISGRQQYSQVQATILVTNVVTGQAQADIKTTYQGYGNAQGAIKVQVIKVAQAQAIIQTVGRGYAQAQAAIVSGTRGYAQAQAYIVLSGQQAFAQAQAIIIKAAGYAQAQAFILQPIYLHKLVIGDRAGITLVSGDREETITSIDVATDLIVGDRSPFNLVMGDRETTLTVGDRNFE